MATSYKSSRKGSRKYLVLLVAVLILGGLLGYKFLHDKNINSAATSEAKVKPAPARSKSYKPVSPTSTNQGGAIDKSGATTQTTEETSPQQWTTSGSGLITLQQPIANSTLNSGDTIRGTAKVSTVQYRLVDDQVGVLAQGSLNVVNGKFSGILQFTPHAQTGALKVYSIDPGTGAEVNHADIKVRFNP